MYIIPIGWLYVALMMAVAEATSSNGTVLGASITFLLYGLAPVALVVYLMGAPARSRAVKAIRAQEAALRPDGKTAPLIDPDGSGHAPAAAQSSAIAPVRKAP